MFKRVTTTFSEALMLLLMPQAPAHAQGNGAATIEEIIVTATKRGPQDVQAVPLSVSVVGRERIDKSGLAEMDDYVRALPAANFLERGAGRNNVVLRGVSSDPQNDTTVGIYIDETPVTGLGSYGIGNPDLKLLDVDRVEVLRGPQGTLYGDGSMGGTLRVMPARGNTEQFELGLSMDHGRTNGTGGGNDIVNAMVNFPLVDGALALRLVGYRFDTSGYYDNIANSDPDKALWGQIFGAPAIDEANVGATEYQGGRVMLEWASQEQYRLSLTLLSQDIDQNGLPEASLNLSEFQQARFKKFSGGGEGLGIDFDLTSIVLEYQFDSFKLLSSTSNIETRAIQDRDVGIFFAAALGVGDIPLFLTDITGHDSFAQEIRVSSDLPGSVQYLFGLFYQDIDAMTTQEFLFEGQPGLDPFGGALLFDSLDNRNLQQKAIFGDLSYDFTDKLVGSIGMRFYDYEQETFIGNDGLFSGGMTTERNLNEDDGSTFSVDLDYFLIDSIMVYARFAQGFRLGGTHPLVPASVCDVDGDSLIDGIGVRPPERILSDDLDTYEIGAKLKLGSGRVVLNSSVFVSDWTGIPVTQIAPCGFPVTLNAGGAESRGLEIEGSWAINDILHLDFGASYVEPELTQAAPALGRAGDRLPGTPKYQVAAGLQADFAIANKPTYVRLDILNIDDFYNNLQEVGVAAGGYTTTALRGGVVLGNFRLDAYVDNLSDEEGLTWVDTEVGDGRSYALRPRTYGLRLSYRVAPRD